MLSFIKFIRRHRRKLYFLSSLIGFTYIARKLYNAYIFYVNQHKIKSSKINPVIFAKIKKAEYFQTMLMNTQKITETFINNIESIIYQHLDKDKIVERLEEISNTAQNDGEMKVQLFKQLKILSFTKLFMLNLTTSFVLISTSIQLSVLSGYLFKNNQQLSCIPSQLINFNNFSSLVGNDVLNNKVQYDFVNAPILLIKSNINELESLMKLSVENHLKKISLKDNFTTDRLHQLAKTILEDVRRSFEAICIRNMESFVQPSMENGMSNHDLKEHFMKIFQINSLDLLSELTEILLEHSVNIFSTQVTMPPNQQSIKVAAFQPSKVELDSSKELPLAKIILPLWYQGIDKSLMFSFTRTQKFRNRIFSIFNELIDPVYINIDECGDK